MATIGDLILKLTADADGLVRELKDSESALDAFAGHVETTAKAVSAAVVALTVKKLTTEIVELTREMGALAERTERVSQITGIAAQTLESWSVAMERSNTSQDALAHGMVTLSRQLVSAADEGSETSQMLKAVHIDLEAVGSTEQFIALLADRFVTMADGVEKTAIATHFLGRGALELIPLFNRGSREIEALTAKSREFGLVLTDLQRHELTAVDDAFDDLGLAVKGLKNQLAADFAPTVTLALQGLTALIAGITTGFQQLGVRLADVVNTINFMAQSILAVGDSVLSLDVMMAGGFGRLKDRLSGIKDEARAIHEMAKAEHAAIGAGLPRDAAAPKPGLGGLGGLSEAELMRRAGIDQEGLGRAQLYNDLMARGLKDRAEKLAGIDQEGLGRAQLYNDLMAQRLAERAAQSVGIDQEGLGRAQLYNDLMARGLKDRAEKLAGIDQEGLGRAQLYNDLMAQRLEERAARQAAIDQEGLGRAQLYNDLMAQRLEERAARQAAIDQEGLGRAQLYNDLMAQRLEERAARQAAIDQEGLGRAQLYNDLMKMQMDQREVDALEAEEEARRQRFDREAEAEARAREAQGQFIQHQLNAERPRFVAAEDLDRAQQMADLTGHSFNKAALEIQLTEHALQQMLRNGVDPASAGIQEMAARLKDLAQQEDIKREWHEIGSAVAGSMNTMVQGVLLGTQTIDQAFKRMVQNILLSLASKQLERAITGLFGIIGDKAGFSPSSLGGFIVSLFGGGGGAAASSAPAALPAVSTVAFAAEGGYFPGRALTWIGEKEPEYAVPESKVPGFVRAMGGAGEAGPIYLKVILNNPIDPRALRRSDEEIVQVVAEDVQGNGKTRDVILSVTRS